MGEERKKSETRVDYEGTIEEVAAEHSSAKTKKKKSRENKDRFAQEDVEITEKSKKKKRVDSDAEEDAKKSKTKNDEIKLDSEAEDVGKKSRKRKKKSEIRVDSEADDDGKEKKKKKKKESGGDEIVISESSRVCESSEGNQMDEKPLESTDDVKTETGKRKLDDTDFGVEDNTDKEMKRKTKKKKPSLDSEVEENSSDSPKYAKKKRKEKKLSEDPEVEENSDSTKDAKKKKKKKKKKKQSEGSEAEENNNDGTKKKKRKKKQSDEDATTPSSKSAKKVKFSDQVEVFPSEDGEESEEEDDGEEVEMVRGKRFTEEEDDLVKNAVYEYIDNHALGDEGLKMVLECKSYPQIRGCWNQIGSALPWRPKYSVYHRAHILFEAGSKGTWNEEDFQLVKEFQKKHGNDWRTLADAMGKNRKHVKDAWRRIRLAAKKKNGHWSREEYQTLFDLVNRDIRMKAFQEKHSKHGMLRDNIPWMAISDQLGSRDHTICCVKWYDQLTSPMVAKGVWANVDDYRLLDELTKLDAACVDDVDWDNLLDNRDGEACRK